MDMKTEKQGLKGQYVLCMKCNKTFEPKKSKKGYHYTRCKECTAEHYKQRARNKRLMSVCLIDDT